MSKDKEPQLGSFFRVTLGGKESVGVFLEVSGLSSETDVTEKSSKVGGLPVLKKLPGAKKWGDITLKRGLDSNLDLWKWRQQVEREGPKAAALDGTIELLDAQGRPVTTYTFLKGWPRKYSGPALNAASNDVAIETIEITHEGLERT